MPDLSATTFVTELLQLAGVLAVIIMGQIVFGLTALLAATVGNVLVGLSLAALFGFVIRLIHGPIRLRRRHGR